MDTQDYLTTGQAAAELGVSRAKLAYLIERGSVPAPTATVPGRRLFTRDDLSRIASALAARQDRHAVLPSPGDKSN